MDYIELRARTLALFFRLADVQGRFFDGFEGVTRAEAHAVHSMYLLKSLGFCPSCRPGEIAAKLRISPSAFSQMLKGIEAKGFIERTRSSEDCRAVRIELTEAGVALGAEVDRRIAAVFSAVIDQVGEEPLKESALLFDRALDVVEASILGGEEPAEGGERP